MPKAASASGGKGRSTRSTSRSRGRARSRSRTPTRSPKKSKSGTREVKVKLTRVDAEDVAPVVATPKIRAKRSAEAKSRSPSATGRRQSTRTAAKLANAAITNTVAKETPRIEKHQSDSDSSRDPGLLWSLSTLIWALAIVGISFAMITLAARPRDCSIWNFRIPLVSKKMLLDVDMKAIYLLGGFLGFQAFMQVLPIGSLVTGPYTSSGYVKQRANGLIALVASLALFPAIPSQWFEYVKDSNKILKEMIYLVAVSVLLSIVLYVKARKLPSSKLNPTGNTSRTLINWYSGREVQPTIFGYSVKAFLFRVGLIGGAVLSAVYPYLLWEEKKMVSPTLSLAAAMHLLYLACFFWDEEGLLHCYENTTHGTGFESCTMLFMPFVFTVNLRFLYAGLITGRAGTELPMWALILLGCTWMIGFGIMFSANSTKNGYRKDPTNAKYDDLVTQAGRSGKKLICSGLWGWVRHPNYLGDIISSFCWAAVTGVACGVFYIYPLLVVSFLWYRAVMVEQTCARKHGVAWEKYCLRVPNRICPNLFPF